MKMHIVEIFSCRVSSEIDWVNRDPWRDQISGPFLSGLLHEDGRGGFRLSRWSLYSHVSVFVNPSHSFLFGLRIIISKKADMLSHTCWLAQYIYDIRVVLLTRYWFVLLFCLGWSFNVKNMCCVVGEGTWWVQRWILWNSTGRIMTLTRWPTVL